MGTIAQTFNPSISEEEVGGLCELKAILTYTVSSRPARGV